MGVTLAVENEPTQANPNVCGGIDFSRLPHRSMAKLSAGRTQSFQVIFRQSALNRIHAHGDSSPRAEICGVLVGDVYQDDTGAFLLVEHIIEGQSSTSSAGQVTFTADTWQHIQLLMDKQYPDLRIVGWYHTHPGHGVFLSEMDIFLHESFFGLPWQTALVYDPRSGEEGVFSDEPATTKTFHSPVYTPPAQVASEPPKIVPVVRVRKRRFWYPFRQIVLGVIRLTLFAMAGMLLGLIIRLQHIEIPYWIQRMTHG
jgi:proteasome lid subunit RPN8/RPN11